MNFQLYSDYPAWFWFACIACGLAYATAMYFREKKIKEAIAAMWWKRLLYAFRFIAVTILAILLINPYLKSHTNKTEKPVIIIAQDNSSSILQGGTDSAAIDNMIASLHKAFDKDYDVQTYVFGESLKPGMENLNFNDRSTDISTAISELNNLYENLNVGALILASDGIYNTGSNPVYTGYDLGARIYTIALGDTIQKKDIRITSALHNKIVYLKDRFIIRTEIEAVFYSGTNAKVSITEVAKGNNKILGEKNISVSGDQFNTELNWEITADEPGIRHYQVRVQNLEGELTTDNNIRDIYIEVLDARQKILLLANSPHPDLTAIKQSIESNQNYQVDIIFADQYKGALGDYNMVILHQLPSTKFPIANLLTEAKDKQIPLWFITGSQTSLTLFNKAQNLLSITGGAQSANEVTATTDKNFNLFTVEDKTIGVIPRLPALSAPYGQYNSSPASQVLLYQKIGAVTTKNPLLLLSLPGQEKYAVLSAENLWKWRLYDYVINKDQLASNEIISKTVQYLSAKNDKKQFRITQFKNMLNETESVALDAELYNESYELVNEPDATLIIKNEDGNDFPFQFSKTGKAYTLNAGYFPAGNYTYSGSVVYNGKTFTDNGAFSISPIKLETLNTTANHKLLNQLAVESGGEMIFPEQSDITRLTELINNSAAAKPVMREITKTQSIINLKWLFFVILIFLVVEWFIRKFNGSY